MAQSLLRRPRRTTPGLMLIPLVDVIFLMLTFFMLASSIDPFSLLSFDDYRTRAQGGPAQRKPVVAQAPPDLLLAVSHGSVQANGETVAMGDFPGEASALRARGMETVVVFTRPSATVQDIVSVLDALKKAPFRSVVIRGRGPAAGSG